MRGHSKWIAALSATTLLGCGQAPLVSRQDEPPSTLAAWRIEPVQRLVPTEDPRAARLGREELFRQARAAQQAGQLGRAREMYVRLLAQDFTHAEALSSLGVIDAGSGQVEQAIDHFRRALVLQPRAGHLHNNLGYALLLAGRLDEADQALTVAEELNPTSTVTRQNRELLAQARLQAGGAVVVSAPDSAKPEPASRPSLEQIAPQVYVLHGPSGDAVAQPAPAVVSPTVVATIAPATRAEVVAPVRAQPVQEVASLRGVRLEVSNGVGIRHMARRTAERLAPTGVVAARLTNLPGYHQAQTEIQFGHDQRAAAAALAQRLPRAPVLTAVPRLERNIQVRLVLGRDLVGQAIARWTEEPQSEPLALNPRLGWIEAGPV